jgi:hypothetical protein
MLGILQHQDAMTVKRNVLGYLGENLGLGGLDATRRTAASAALVVCVLALLWRTWRGRPWIDQLGWAFAALLVALGSLRVWYLIWVLPFGALAASRRVRAAALALTVIVVAMRVTPLLIGGVR